MNKIADITHQYSYTERTSYNITIFLALMTLVFKKLIAIVTTPVRAHLHAHPVISNTTSA